MNRILNFIFIFFVAFSSSLFGYDRITFLHIPKCGGTTVYYLFKHNFNDSEIYPFRKLVYNNLTHILYDPSVLEAFPEINERVVSGHFPYWFLKAKDPNFDSTFMFTVLRDPIERIMSQHRDFLRAGLGKEFSYCPHYCNTMCKMLCSNTDLDGEELIQDCIQNLKRINFIILMDTYDQDIDKLFSQLGLQLPDNDKKGLRWLNKTQGTHFDVYLDDKIKQKIYEMNQCDVKLYEYIKAHLKDNKISDD